MSRLQTLRVLLALLALSGTALGTEASDLSRLILELTSRRGALTLVDKKLARKSEATTRGPLLLRRAELLTDVGQLQQHLADEKHAEKSEWKTAARAAVTSAREAAVLLNGTQAAHARFLAGRNLYELNDRPAALAELTQAAGTAERAESIAASLLSGEILNQQSRFAETIALLEPVWAQCTAHTKAFQTVGENLAWAYYNAKRYPEAVKTLQRSFGERLPVSARPVLAHFLATAAEEKTTGFAVSDTARLFESLTKDSDERRALIGEYAKALAGRHQGGLLRQLAAAASESLGASGVYDLRLRAVAACGEVADLACLETELKALRAEKETLAQALPGEENRARYRRILEESAGRLANRVQKSSPVLAAAYELALVFAPRTRGDEARLQFNAGEASFQAQTFDSAVAHYRRAAEVGDPELRARAALRAVAARYADFQARKEIPTDLHAVAPDALEPKELSAPAREWMNWVERLPWQDNGIAYRFEAYRLLYAAGHIDEACRKLQALAEKAPASAFATKAAALVLDTDLAGKRWDRAAERIARFLKQKAWETTPLHARLVEVAPEVAHQRILAALSNNDNAAARRIGEEAMRSLPPTPALATVGEMLGNLVLAAGDPTAAGAIYGKAAALTNGALANRLHARGELTQALSAENHFRFLESASHYLQLLKNGRAVLEELALGESLGERVLETAWRSGDVGTMRALLANPVICPAKSSSLCDRYRAFTAMLAPENARLLETDDELARFASATAAMENGARLSVAQRIELLAALTPPTDLPIALRAAFLKHFAGFLDETAQAIAQQAPVKLDRASLARRKESVERFSRGLKPFDDCNLAPGKTAARLARARVYADFATEIRALPAPAGLTQKDRVAYTATLEKRSSTFAELADTYRQEALAEAWALPGSPVSTALWTAYAKAHPAEAAGEKASRALASDGGPSLASLPVFTGPNAPLAQMFRDALTMRHFAGAAAVLEGLQHTGALRDGEADFLNGALALAAGDPQLASQALESARSHGRVPACAELAKIYTASAQTEAMRALSPDCLPPANNWATPIVAKSEEAP